MQTSKKDDTKEKKQVKDLIEKSYKMPIRKKIVRPSGIITIPKDQLFTYLRVRTIKAPGESGTYRILRDEEDKWLLLNYINNTYNIYSFDDPSYFRNAFGEDIFSIEEKSGYLDYLEYEDSPFYKLALEGEVKRKEAKSEDYF